MKEKIDAVLVVEGKSDVAFLESFLEADFVITNGSEISKETLRYIEKLSQSRTIIVLTDPDYPGLQIRSKIEEKIQSVKHAYVKKELSIRHHKVGVAESQKEEVLRALHQVIDGNESKKTSDITMQDLYRFGFLGEEDSKELRIKAANDFALGYAGNAKRFFKDMQALCVQKEELERWKKEHDCK